MTTEQIQAELALLAEELKTYGERVAALATHADGIAEESGDVVAVSIANGLVPAGGFLATVVFILEGASTARRGEEDDERPAHLPPALAQQLASFEQAYMATMQSQKTLGENFELSLQILASIIRQVGGSAANNDNRADR